MTNGTFVFTPLVSITSSFGPAGTGHLAGLVPDLGSQLHNPPYLLGDNATFIQITGAGVSYNNGT